MIMSVNCQRWGLAHLVRRIITDRSTLSGDVPEDQKPLSSSKLFFLRSNPSIPSGLLKTNIAKKIAPNTEFGNCLLEKMDARVHICSSSTAKLTLDRGNFVADGIVLVVHSSRG